MAWSFVVWTFNEESRHGCSSGLYLKPLSSQYLCYVVNQLQQNPSHGSSVITILTALRTYSIIALSLNLGGFFFFFFEYSQLDQTKTSGAWLVQIIASAHGMWGWSVYQPLYMSFSLVSRSHVWDVLHNNWSEFQFSMAEIWC